ncbi:MAG TPA: S8 family serine peptidase [Thermoanaerobaculia bacterium]|nr:S8 family serine peptidase [Thermoanaerobaculia bacterium]
MIKKRVLQSIFCLLSLLVAASSFAATTQRYLVATRTPIRVKPLRMLADPVEAVAHDVQMFEHLDAFAADLTDEEAAALRKSSHVRAISPVVPRSLAAVSGPVTPVANGTPYINQTSSWGLADIKARQVWPVSRGANVNVAVMDTGIDLHHPDLIDRYVGGYNTFTQGNDPQDDNRHGTHVAGIIGATDNSFGVVGVAPEVKIWAVKILNANGQGTDENVAAGFNWLLAQKEQTGGRWIANLSIGSNVSSVIEEEAITRAIDAGIIVVAAAGNRSFASVDYPAQYKGVIAVGALDPDDRLAEYSSYGVGLWITAPGTDVVSTMPVGSVPAADVTVAGQATLKGFKMVGSPAGDVLGELVFCGYGAPEDFPPDVAGKIALISRNPVAGQMLFRDKAKNAKNAGAIASIIFNIEGGTKNEYEWTLWPLTCVGTDCAISQEDKNFPHNVAVSIDKDAGKKLLAAQHTMALVSARLEDYQAMSGTSMATPHVSGAIALLLGVSPDATTQQIENALLYTARDFGTYGWDLQYGFGAIDVLKAAQVLNPAAFGLSQPPPYTVPRKRAARH